MAAETEALVPREPIHRIANFKDHMPSAVAYEPETSVEPTETRHRTPKVSARGERDGPAVCIGELRQLLKKGSAKTLTAPICIHANHIEMEHRSRRAPFRQPEMRVDPLRFPSL